LRYALLFTNDITYTIGKSDFHKDWFFEQVPRANNLSFVNPTAKDPANQRFGWMKLGTPDEDMWDDIGRGRATIWTIKFKMARASKGQATLRVSLAGANSNGGMAVAVNGQRVGSIRPISTDAIRYNTDKSLWQECDLTFDAALLKQGGNEMQLTVPAGEVTSGVVYDYLRLELDENHNPSDTPVALSASN
jgi:rhamnogalacturonan endolyase